MYNRRWYDKYTDVTETIDLMRNLDVTQQEILANDVTEVANSIKSYHKEKEITPLSIGLDRVFGLYQHSKARRWYDKSKSLNNAILNISTLPEQDYRNIMESIRTALKN